MLNSERARQFAPFDSLKGLQEALRLKEYENERMVKGDLPEEKIEEISKTILNISKNQEIIVTYFFDGYIKNIAGKSKVNFIENYIDVAGTKIYFDDIMDISIVNEKMR